MHEITLIVKCFIKDGMLNEFLAVLNAISFSSSTAKTGLPMALPSGPGFPENVLEKFRKNEFGANDDRFQIGIRNTKDRLQLLYGAEASLMIGNGENLGTEVIIIIPYQNGDEKSEYSISR